MLRRLTAAALAATGIAAVLTAAAPAPALAAPPSCAPGDCFTVSVSLDRAPAVGQDATLTVEVTAKQDIPDATTVIDLPDTLRWVRPPAELSHVAAKIGRSPVDRASRTNRARRGTPVRYEGVVTAVAPGPTSIRVHARDARPGPSSEGLAYLTIGEKSSIFGMPPDDGARRTAMPPPRTSLARDTCVHGRVTHFKAEDGSVTGVPRAAVYGFDSDADDNRDSLGWAMTDDAGAYKLCFPGTEEDGTGQDVSIEVSSSSYHWNVSKPGDMDPETAYYSGKSAVTADVPPGTDQTTIDLQSAPGSPLEGAFRIFTAAYDTWKAYTGWLNEPGNDCWNPSARNCQAVTIRWAPDQVLRTPYYCPIDGTEKCPNRYEIHLDASDQLRRMTVGHELGHFIMDYTHDRMPPYGNECTKHYMEVPSSPACAWSEGWANWVAVQTYDETHFRWGSEAAINLESPRWFSNGWPSGEGADKVEGRVAGVLLDLADSGARNEKYWDTSSLGPAGVVAAFRKAPANDINQFANLIDAADALDASSAFFQNTIYPVRFETLYDRQPVLRPANVPVHQHHASTPDRWSVVATAPSSADGDDVDLKVAPEADLESAVTSSEWGISGPDFVAVQPTQDSKLYRADVTSSTNYQEHVIELAVAPPDQLAQGAPMEFAMGAGNLVEIRTTRIEKGVPATLTVVPRNGQDFDLFVMAPDSGKWGLPRSKARRSTSGGPNKIERITISDPKVTGDYAVIVIKRSGEGGLTLVRT
ncbi:hypothetical protein [Microtetraspora fusca]|uniref:hypothetical protein n=1 Tax=Microtetraspora fusca TaxID=1997 RepID=UPI00082AB964|nr:hypothetical protein [Microtetraspora fusca]